MNLLDVEEWGWKTRPSREAEVEAMMISLDTYLASKGVLPHQRSFAGKSLVARMLNISVSFGAATFGAEDRIDPLLGKVTSWFAGLYANRFNPHFEARSFAINLRGTLWRMRIGLSFGTVQLILDNEWTNTGGQALEQSKNLIHHIEDFTPNYAATLSQAELQAIGLAAEVGINGIDALDEFDGHVLFDMARLDYAHSVDALISGIAWSKAWWESAQVAEKVMKGLLFTNKQSYPKGKDGHIIPRIGGLIDDYFGTALPNHLLNSIDCKPDVRYGEIDATRDEALEAHRALLTLLPTLSRL